MNSLEVVNAAQSDVAQLQTALGTMQKGLDTVETAVETAREVRRGFRRLLKVGLVLAVIGIMAAVVISRRRAADAPEEP